MCEVCWEDAGKPAEYTRLVELAYPLVVELFERSPGGIPWHVELGNWNTLRALTDPYWSQDPAGGSGLDQLLALPEDDDDRPAREHVAVAEALPALWNLMGRGERVTLLAAHSGFIRSPNEENQDG